MMIKISYDANTGSPRTGTVRFTGEGMQNPVDITVLQTDLTFTNPIFDMPDPWVVKQGNTYHACKAGATNGINLTTSTTLSILGASKEVWRCPTDGAVKVWNHSRIWAPELHYIDGRWYIYYTAGRPQAESGNDNFQRCGVLRAKTADPLGQWEDMGMLYTGDAYTAGVNANAENTKYFAIDLTVFKVNGQLYAVWSGHPAPGTGSGQRLYIASMSDPCTISSSRVEISKPDQGWERYSGEINEGPAFLKSPTGAKKFIVYSANGSWTKYYNLGTLELINPANPLAAASWRKSTGAVFTRNDNTADVNGINGVGHCSFTKSPDETEDWIVYHSKNRNTNSYDGGRSTYIKKFTWNEDQTPDFGMPVGYGEASALPSGESR
jgi:GH43 family beta-xylosidase